ncbi:MAG: methylmalonyl Co-A mutase-associated GTPase MeaB [Chloroflexi bacterium]|nr:methylmalonyl Co-A mutase-associated GTPase MeaB [Chloroflexota bacterium]
MTSTSSGALAALVAGVERGDRRALARLITHVENRHAGVDEALTALYPRTGRAHIVGVTGAPGTGKSTLVAALAREERRRGRSVGIVSVDPTSPYTGGALLGDRIRMQDLTADRGVYMRSLASRGSVGGLSESAADVVRVIDAFGRDIIFVETVGAGQAEVDIARAAQTTIVIEAPGLGDEIQAFKAGILEIADVFVINKADREGADRTANAIRTMLDIGIPQRGPGEGTVTWRPPILKTVASSDDGVAPLADELDKHLQYLRDSGHLAVRERERIGDELRRRLARALLERRLAAVGLAEVDRLIGDIAARRIAPQAALRDLLDAQSPEGTRS